MALIVAIHCLYLGNITLFLFHKSRKMDETVSYPPVFSLVHRPYWLKKYLVSLHTKRTRTVEILLKQQDVILCHRMETDDASLIDCQ